MGKYRIIISPDAENDIENLTNVIKFDYKSPLTAVRYLKGIYHEINKLKISPTSYVIQTHKSLLQYGLNVRRINYKRMAIIYTVHDNGIVYIHRIVAASAITGL